MRNYRTVSLPIGLVTSIEAYVADRGICQGYVSLSDFVKDACRRRLDELQDPYVYKSWTQEFSAPVICIPKTSDERLEFHCDPDEVEELEAVPGDRV